MADAFLDLQNGWYNGFLKGMGLSEDSFQILQPAPPLIPGATANASLWAYFNNIPPASLTGQFVSSGGNQFFADYLGLLSALEGTIQPPPDPAAVIGEPAYSNWVKYVEGLANAPSINQLPTLFRNWAMLHAPGVAMAGATAYSQILLDPVLAAQTEATMFYSPPATPDWSVGYAGLAELLAKAPGRDFKFSSETMNINVSGSWTGGGNTGFFGLWGNSSSSSSLSEKFASSFVTVTAHFDHVMTFLATPGSWYNSSAVGLAFAKQAGNPWNPSSSINWQNTFGSDGNMQRFAANLIVASGMKISVTSSAAYSTSDQTTIKSNSSAGFWPFYAAGGGSSSTNTVKFATDETMTIETASVPGIPLVLGCNVLSASEFLGHSAEAAKRMAALRQG